MSLTAVALSNVLLLAIIFGPLAWVCRDELKSWWNENTKGGV